MLVAQILVELLGRKVRPTVEHHHELQHRFWSSSAYPLSAERSAVQRRTPNGRRERNTAARRRGHSPRRRGTGAPPSERRGRSAAATACWAAPSHEGTLGA